MQFVAELVVLLCFFQYFCDVEAASNKALYCRIPNSRLMGMKSLSNKDKQRILDKHNQLRNLVASGGQKGQPPAENMLEMKWDDYAAKQAFDWASRCEFKHNSPKDEKKNPMGQNLYMQYTTLRQDVNKTFDAYIDGFIQAWYDEVKLYKYGDGFSTATGHYTQVAWAKSSKVGCGYSYYQQKGWNVGYLVCNYSPAGNYFGQNPYKTGKVNCKKYNLEPSSDFPHLCISRD